MTPAAYARQLQQLLPRGVAWTDAPGSVLLRLLSALGDTLARAQADIDTLLDEADPATTYALLEEWEASAGLPDACVTAPQTIPARQRALTARLTATGGASAAYFIGVAESLGYTAAVEDVAPHVWRLNVAEDAGVSLFRVGSSAVGDRLRTFGDQPLECTINRLKPAHTRCLFAYGVPNVSN